MIASAVIAAVLSKAAGAPGLAATVSPIGGGMRIAAGTDHGLSGDSVEELASRVQDSRARIEWTGYVYCPELREYEFGVDSSGPVSLTVEDSIVVSTDGRADNASGKISLTAGQHPVVLQLDHTEGKARLKLYWDARNPYRLDDLPIEVLSPAPLGDTRWSIRATAPIVAAAVSACWSGAVIWALWLALRRPLSTEPLDDSLSWRLFLSAAAIFFGAGIWWGWPASWWAPDELDPPAVLAALASGFSNGWFDRYPPLHYYVLAIVYSPALVGERLGWFSTASDSIVAMLYLEGRLLTLGMALATLSMLSVLARRTLGREYALPVAFCAGAFLPFVFYAKLVNLDVPYLFWFVMSLLYLIENRTA